MGKVLGNRQVIVARDALGLGCTVVGSKEDFVVLGIEACSINVLGVGLESEIYDSMPVETYGEQKLWD